MTYLHLIRHGEPASGWGEPGGSPDPGLTDLGRRQAREAADWLTAPDLGARPGRILSSPLRRCRETAALFAEFTGLDVTIEPGVAEIPTPQGVVGPARAPWLRTAMEGDWGAVEGIDGLAWRARVVETLLQAGGAAVFTHFVAINAAVTAAMGSPAVLAFRPAPGSVTTLRVEGGSLHLERLGKSLDGGGRVL